MGAACGCMQTNEKGEKVTKKGIVMTGGTVLGGETANAGDVAAQRAARFEKSREDAKYRGVSKEGRIEMKMKE